MKIVFAGTTGFGIPTLEKIKDSVVLIVTQPDRPAGRKQTLTPPPIKLWAEKNNIPVIQPEKIIDANDKIREEDADLLLVAAYGQIIPKEVLDIPKHGSMNVHGSLLPKYRGAAPIQAAILNGDGKTGITLIKMDEKLDHGPIIVSAPLDIKPDENFTALYHRLAELSATLVSKSLPSYLNGNMKPAEQKHDQATFTQMLTKADGRISWTSPAKQIHHQILALNPEPGTWTMFNDKSVKILKTELLMDNKIELAGKLYRVGSDLAVKCTDYGLKIVEVQPEGKKPMSGQEFLNGIKNLETKMFI